LQAKGGINIAPNGFLKGVAEHFKGLKAVTICDESNSGLGRIGKESWGFKWQNHVPDIITIGSSLGNGSALSAVVTRKEIASVIKHAWFNTFAAGHMQTKIGIAVINTINQEKLNENAEKVGSYILSGLESIAKKYTSIGGVRGKGLLLGIDIVENGEPSKEKALELMELTRERKLLFGRGGPYGNVLLIRPPLCITKADATYLLQALEDALTKLK
jgi:alanine-glyoxylate transaminase/(R)-3-amino-2-methylpropionate-pyruvate transaminase